MSEEKSKKYRILLVDDDDLIRMTQEAYLTDSGFTTVEACDADQALAMLELRPTIDLVISDINMPGTLDGEGLATVVNLQWPHLPLVLTSAQPMRRALASYRHRFLLKPYSLEKMEALIRLLLT